MSTIRSPRRAASRTLWVTKMTVSRRSVQIRSNSSCRRSRVIASSAPNGSSISSTGASRPRVRASATRCRMPPESSCGCRLPNSSRCTRCSSSATRCLSVPSRQSSQRQRQADVAGDRQPRKQRRLLEHQRRRARALDDDLALGRGIEPGHEREQGALAAAGRPDEADELARRDGERDPVERAVRRLAPDRTLWTHSTASPRPRSSGRAVRIRWRRRRSTRRRSSAAGIPVRVSSVVIARLPVLQRPSGPR